MEISNKAVAAIKGNNKIIGRMVAEFDRHSKTIHVWLKEKNIMLTTPKAVSIIMEETGLAEEEILVAQTTNA